MNKTIVGAVFALAALSANASTLIFGGFEDTPTGDKDYNDITFTISGATLMQTGGVFTNLTAALPLTNSGTPFWNNQSSDGVHDNIGDYWEGEGGYSGGPVAPNLQYLATSGGGLVSMVDFSGGAMVTISGGITADTDKLEVCYVSNCAGTTQVVSGSLTFLATSTFEVLATVNGGTPYYSDAMGGEASSFAFATSTSASAPEPATLAMVGGALLLVSLFGRKFARK